MKPAMLPKVDADALFAMQKGNMDTLVQAQAVVISAIQAATRMQYGLVNDCVVQAQAMLEGKFDADRKPEAYLADVKAAADKVVTVAQAQMDLGVKAQAEAVDLIAKRAQMNVDELQKFAA